MRYGPALQSASRNFAPDSRSRYGTQLAVPPWIDSRTTINAPGVSLAYLDGYVTKQVRSLPMEQVWRALADDSRRTLLETLAGGPATAGELAAKLPIARPGVSRHLRVLREAGLVDVHREGQRRIYELRPEPLAEVDEWLSRYRALWEQRLDALHTEVARGKRERRSTT